MKPQKLIGKELASELNVNRKYVEDMRRGGFKTPATIEEAQDWLEENPYPTRFRNRHVNKGK